MVMLPVCAHIVIIMKSVMSIVLNPTVSWAKKRFYKEPQTELNTHPRSPLVLNVRSSFSARFLFFPVPPLKNSTYIHTCGRHFPLDLILSAFTLVMFSSFTLVKKKKKMEREKFFLKQTLGTSHTIGCEYLTQYECDNGCWPTVGLFGFETWGGGRQSCGDALGLKNLCLDRFTSMCTFILHKMTCFPAQARSSFPIHLGK